MASLATEPPPPASAPQLLQSGTGLLPSRLASSTLLDWHVFKSGPSAAVQTMGRVAASTSACRPPSECPRGGALASFMPPAARRHAGSQPCMILPPCLHPSRECLFMAPCHFSAPRTRRGPSWQVRRARLGALQPRSTRFAGCACCCFVSPSAGSAVMHTEQGKGNTEGGTAGSDRAGQRERREHIRMQQHRRAPA